MGKVLVISALHTGPEYGKGFLCFLVCTQVLNMGKVLEFSGLHVGPEHENGFSVFWSAHRF
jgi:hypothetical protein